MTKLRDTRDLARFLDAQAQALSEFSGGFAKELVALSALFNELDPVQIKDLKKIPNTLAQAQAEREKAIRDLAEARQDRKDLVSKFKRDISLLKQEHKAADAATNEQLRRSAFRRLLVVHGEVLTVLIS